MFNRRGRTTFKSAEYLAYQEEIREHLLGEVWPFGDDQVGILVTAGLSNRGADIDNVIKPLLDTLQSVFEDFNDNKVYALSTFKDIVPKGEEYIEVMVDRITDEN